MATIVLNCEGLRCPQPILKIATKVPELQEGDILEITADCPTFKEDLNTWAERTKKTILFCNNEGGMKMKAQIQF